MLQPVLVRAVGHALSAHRRRAAAARQHRGPAPRSPRAGARSRRSTGLRAGDGRKPPARRPERDRQGQRLPRIPLALRRHPGRARRPARRRSLDRLQPDPPARASRESPRRRPPQRDHPGPRPGPPGPPGRREPVRCLQAESSTNTSRCARPRPSSPPESRPRRAPGSAKTRLTRSWPGPPIFSISSNGSIDTWARPVLIRARNPDRGQIIIDYQSREEFDRLASLLRASGRLVRNSLKLVPLHLDRLRAGSRARPTDGDGYRRARDRQPLRSDEGASHFPVQKAWFESLGSPFQSGGRNRLALRTDLYYLISEQFAQLCTTSEPCKRHSHCFTQLRDNPDRRCSHTDFAETPGERVPVHEFATKRGNGGRRTLLQGLVPRRARQPCES